MALGAQRQSVVSMIVKDGMPVMFLGAAGRVALTLWTIRFLTKLLYGVTPLDHATLGTVVLVLLSVSFVAVYIPARRAASVDPVAVRLERTGIPCSTRLSRTSGTASGP